MRRRSSRGPQKPNPASQDALLDPGEAARRLLRELNVQALPIQPQHIAAQLNVVVWEREMAKPYDGCLMRVGDAWGILLNRTIESQSRKNFTIAHELGHYALDSNQMAQQHHCESDDLRSFDAKRLEEQRANQFAVELLMPYPIFLADAVELAEVGLPAIDALASRYSTSLTSTAIRYTRLSTNTCAIVFSENGHVKYFAYSEGFRLNSNCYLERNKPLHTASLAFQLAERRPKEVTDAVGEVPLSYWCTTQSDRVVVEQSRFLPRLNQVVSFLWLRNG